MDDIRNNFLKKRPICVVWIGRHAPDDALESMHAVHTFCFIGSRWLPKYVKGAISKIVAMIEMHGANSGQVRDACDNRELINYLDCSSGNEVFKVLGLNLAQHVKDILSKKSYTNGGIKDDSFLERVGGARASKGEIAPEEAELIEIEKLLSDAADKAESAEELSKVYRVAQTEQAPQFIDGGITFVDDAAMYPEDSFMDIKRKIFATTKIPIYRQHVAAWNNKNEMGPTVSYNLFTTGSHIINFHELYDNQSAGRTSIISLFGIPIDRSIYDLREDLRIEAKDHILTIDDIRPDFFIVFDLATWVVPVLEQIRAALVDNYQFEMLYYGFIVKYFPQLTRDCFHSYIVNENEMSDKFPDLAPILTTVRASVLAQCQISNNVYMRNIKPRADINHIILRASVTSAKPGSPISHINLRDFFDSITCSSTILDVRAIVDDTSASRTHKEISRFELRKFFKSSELMSATAGQQVKISCASSSSASICPRVKKNPSLGGEPGLIILFVWNELPMFMIIRATGKFTFQFQWSEEDEIDFGIMTELFKKHTGALIKELRRDGVFAANNIAPINESNMYVQSLTVVTRWEKTLSARQFRLLREMWGEYVRAGIIIPHQTAKDIFSFIFTRGMHSIDTYAFETQLAAANIIENNHYAYLSVSAMRQKWIQNFAGRTVNINHRATDIRFDVLDIYENEYQIFEAYLSAFITNYEKIHGADADDNSAIVLHNISSERRRLRRLQEIDPELYNLKKHGAPYVYAQKCQGSKQPVLYSEHEKIPRGAIKYWNFTKNRPAFYTCSDPKYPHLNFIVNTHPRGYCIPCCGKMKPTHGSKHAIIEKICLENHSYNVSQLIEQPISYVMSFGKDLPEGRFSNLPAGHLRDTLNRAASSTHAGSELLIFGVPQTLSIIHTLRSILDMSVSDFIEGITNGLEKNIIEFDTIANGRAAIYFASKRTFIGYLASIAGGSITFPEGTADFMRSVMSDCARIVYDLEMIYLLTADDAQNMRIIVNQKHKKIAGAKIGFAVIGQDKSINPVLTIHLEDFARNGSVVSRVLIPECASILYQIVRGFEQHSMKNIDLIFMRTYAKELGYSIRKLYIGLRGLCYAVQLRELAATTSGSASASASDNVAAYMPIMYSSDIQKKPEEDIAFDSLDDAIQLSACLRVIDKINNLIVRKHLSFYKIVIDAIAVASAGAMAPMSTTAPSIDEMPIGLIIRTGNISSIMYFTMKQDTLPDIPHRNLTIDPRRHARMLLGQGTSQIYNGSVIARISNEAANRLYPYYEYELFCIQFMARARTLHNEKVRTQVQDIINSKQSIDAKSSALRELSLSKHDYGILTKMLQNAGRKHSSLLSINLEADLDELYAHIDKDKLSDLAQWIQKFIEPVIIREDKISPPTIAQVPLIISSCSGGNAPHCSSDGRLIIRNSLETLSEILAADLQNPIKRTYIFAKSSYPESRAAFTDFTQKSGEILLVKKYTIQM